jgi:hypothetical protein
MQDTPQKRLPAVLHSFLATRSPHFLGLSTHAPAKLASTKELFWGQRNGASGLLQAASCCCEKITSSVVSAIASS